MIAQRIELTEAGVLEILWDDGHRGAVSLRTLRDNCPCAGCRGETILFHTYKPIPQAETPGKYQLTQAQPIGHYALQLVWGDGHSTGLYPWEELRKMCECPECRRNDVRP